MNNIKVLLGVIGLVASINASEIYATFNVKAHESANLAFDASGVVESVKTDISLEVKKGDILASLENSDKRASLDIAKTALVYAKKDYDRQVAVRKLIDASKFDAVAFKHDNAKNQLALQQSLYNKTFLKAPFDGVIFFKEVEVGDTVSGMMLKTVFKIQSKSKRKLVVEFDQKYNNIVKIGDKFEYKVDGDDKLYTGEISKIYPSANANNRKVQAEVKAQDIMVGLFGDGKIITNSK